MIGVDDNRHVPLKRGRGHADFLRLEATDNTASVAGFHNEHCLALLTIAGSAKAILTPMSGMSPACALGIFVFAYRRRFRRLHPEHFDDPSPRRHRRALERPGPPPPKPWHARRGAERAGSGRLAYRELLPRPRGHRGPCTRLGHPGSWIPPAGMPRLVALGVRAVHSKDTRLAPHCPVGGAPGACVADRLAVICPARLARRITGDKRAMAIDMITGRSLGAHPGTGGFSCPI
jgi:hypothetical protein